MKYVELPNYLFHKIFFFFPILSSLVCKMGELLHCTKKLHRQFLLVTRCCVIS